MAARSYKKSRHLAGLALAVSIFAIPAAALANPENDGRGGWQARGEDDGREARSDEGGQGRQAQAQQQTQPDQAEAPASAPGPRQTTWSGGNDGGGNPQESRRDVGPNRGNWNGGNAAPQAPSQPAPAPSRNWGDNRGQRQAGQQGGEQPGWSGGHRQDGDHARRQERRPDNRQSNTWYDNRGDQSGSRNWSDRDGRRHDRDGDRSTTFYNNSGYNHDDDRDHHQWDRRWRSNTSYNWYSYRSYHPSYYRLGTYYAPYRNYSYRRLTIGFFLDQLFFGQNYWISSPGNYRLPDVYGPYRWVRYYDDAVLVDAYSGEVVDVIYNFFW